MKGFFHVYHSVKKYMRSQMPDPEDKIFTTQVLITCGVLHLQQSNIHATKSELKRVTDLPTSSIYRGTQLLMDRGFLGYDGKVFSFPNPLPADIRNLSTADEGMSIAIFRAAINEMKQTIIDRLDNGTLSVSEADKDQIAQTFEQATQELADEIEKTGGKRLFGDHLL